MGKVIYPNGDIFRGEWLNGHRKEGTGKSTIGEGQFFEGTWKNFEMSDGTMTYYKMKDGAFFSGEIRLGKPWTG